MKFIVYKEMEMEAPSREDLERVLEDGWEIKEFQEAKEDD